jgi:uncharacterized RDD family membrane protein YckC
MRLVDRISYLEEGKVVEASSVSLYMALRKPPADKFFTGFACFVIGQLILTRRLIVLEFPALYELFIIAAFFLLFFVLFYIGYGWSRWVLVVTQILWSLLLTFGGIEDGDYGFVGAGISHFISAIAVLLTRGSSIAEPSPVLDAPIIAMDATASLENTDRAFATKGPNNYPPLITRYKAMLIDALFLLIIMIVTMVIVGDSEHRSPVMITMGLLAVGVYEPLLTAYSATLGQRIMKVRVRRSSDPSKKVTVLNAYLRALVKVWLGWLSFITINFNPEHRAIHDFAGRSIVVYKGK